MEYFGELDADIALLQEVSSVPSVINERWSGVSRAAVTKKGGPQRFSTAVLVRAEICEPLTLASSVSWVQSELALFEGNLVGCRVRLGEADGINVLSVYSPAWPIDRRRLTGVDTGGVRLRQNRDVWLTDVVLAALTDMEISPDDEWIIGGDLNLSETFDLWKGGPRGNREYLDRMNDFGLVDCLRKAAGVLTPTFRNPRGGGVLHQMDHLFVSRPLAERLAACGVGSPGRVFGRLSDHLPIIADFT
jgi:exonuclease III